MSEDAKPAAQPTSFGSWLGPIGLVVVLVGLGALSYSVMKQRPAATTQSATAGSEQRPRMPAINAPLGTPVLRRVMLSTGGVGYFEYETKVFGDAQISLPVRMDQVDDVLKSLVVFDDKGGTGLVQLPSRAPLSDIFRGLPFGPDALDSNAALLDALKGSEVSVRGSESMSGRIVSVVKEEAKGDNDTTITRHRVGVMATGGLKQFVLEEAASVTFTDPILKQQIEQALASVAEHREGQGRTLKIRSNGDGQRTVTIAYVVEAPLWKPSYRITTKGDGTAHMQGWAILENVSGNDWVDVDLTVVTGNPVTFRQALYSTYYVTRPEIPVEVLGRILPKPDEGSVGAGTAGETEALAPPPPPPAPSPAMAAPSTGGRMKGARDSFGGLASSANQPAKPIAAESKEAATQVTFRMPFAVTVMNGQSLAVPIIDTTVPGELVSLYQPETHPTHPLAALKLTNKTNYGLPAGVLTLYESDKNETSYVGDAQLATLPDTESRMLGFALDQKVQIDREDKTQQTISKATLAHGVFKASIVDQRTTIYTIKGAAKEDRKVVIEHPREAGWELVTPDPKTAEMTPTAFRIPFDVKAGATIKQTVTTQWPRDEEQTVVDLDVDVVLAYASNDNLNAAQRAAFARIAEYKRTIAGFDTQIETEGSARDRVFEDQERIRENIKAVPAGSELQQRYLRSMGQLEDQADAHKKAIDRLEQQKANEQQKLADYVAGLQL